MIVLTCACGKVIQVREEHAGLTIRCRCGRRHVVPGAPRRWRLRDRLSPAVYRWFRRLSWAWLGAVVLAVLLLWGLGDRWWPGTLFLFGPRWPLLVPAPFLLLGALALWPRMLAPLLAGVVLVVGPVLGYRTGWRGWFAQSVEPSLRVITFNMRGGENPLPAMVPRVLVALEPDLIFLQECAEGLERLEGVPLGWVLQRDASLCVISRNPVDSTEANPVMRTAEDGMFGLAVRYHLRVHGQPVTIVNLHLETPRRGIEQVRYGGNPVGLARNILVRDLGSRRTANWVFEPGPDVLVAGDFNLPVESAIYRRYWGRCANAFSRRGHGFGYTRVLPKWSARIDHLLSCGGDWEPVAVRIGPDLGSDHLPLIVDLARR